MYRIRCLAIIGGSGVAVPGQFELHDRNGISTPFGEPSAVIHAGRFLGLPTLYLARHGEPHAIAPHRINYRANLHALAALGASHVIALNTVGGIADDAVAGSLWIPDQIIDYTWGRDSSFHDGDRLPLEHIDFTEPCDHALRELLHAAAGNASVHVQPHGVYGCTQGPRLETAAEIRRLQRDGCDLVGMTAMPEAALARELGLDYALLAMVVNRAAGLSVGPITTQGIREQAVHCLADAMRILDHVPPLVAVG